MDQFGEYNLSVCHQYVSVLVPSNVLTQTLMSTRTAEHFILNSELLSQSSNTQRFIKRAVFDMRIYPSP